MNTVMRPWLLLAAFSSALFLTTIGATRLWDRDEPRNAGCAVEMLERGDWVTPVFNGELRSHKPALLYWCMMLAYRVFGVSEFSARLSSALFGVGTVLCTYGLGRRLADCHVGRWSGVILATTLMFGVAVRAATPDAPLIFFTALAMWLFVREVFPDESASAEHHRSEPSAAAAAPTAIFPARRLFRAGFYGTLGLAVLAKGPVGVVLPLAIVGSFLWIVRMQTGAPRGRSAAQRLGYGLRCWGATAWSMYPLSGLAIVLLVAAPWYIAVGYRTEGQWLREFFFEHNVQRARQPMEGHAGPPFYYLVALLPGFFPWSIFIVPTLIEAWRRLRRGGREAFAMLFCASWLAVWIGAFTLASTKLPSYITPCYPALAVLTAGYLVRWSKCQELVSSVWPWLSLLSLWLAGVGIAVGLPLAAARYLPGEQWLGLIGVIPLAAATYGAWRYYERQRARVLRIVAVSAALLTLALFGLAARRVDRHQQSDRLLAAINDAARTPRVAYLGVLEPSWVFYSHRPLVEVVAAQEAPPHDARAADGDAPHDGDVHVPWDAFLAAGPDHFVITTQRHLAMLPDASRRGEVVATVPYFLKHEQLVLLRGIARTSTAPQSDHSR